MKFDIYVKRWKKLHNFVVEKFFFFITVFMYQILFGEKKRAIRFFLVSLPLPNPGINKQSYCTLPLSNLQYWVRFIFIQRHHCFSYVFFSRQKATIIIGLCIRSFTFSFLSHFSRLHGNENLFPWGGPSLSLPYISEIFSHSLSLSLSISF